MMGVGYQPIRYPAHGFQLAPHLHIWSISYCLSYPAGSKSVSIRPTRILRQLPIYKPLLLRTAKKLLKSDGSLSLTTKSTVLDGL